MTGDWADTVLTVAATIAAGVVAASVVGVLVRVIAGPSRADRIVALDLMAICIVGLVACVAVIEGTPALLDVALAVSVLGFLATVGFARYLERSGGVTAAPPPEAPKSDPEARR